MKDKFDPVEGALQTIIRALEKDEGTKYLEKIKALRAKRLATAKAPAAVEAPEEGSEEVQEQ